MIIKEKTAKIVILVIALIILTITPNSPINLTGFSSVYVYTIPTRPSPENNTAPVIVSHSPKEEIISILEPNNQFFSIDYMDKENDPVLVNWLLNETLVGTEKNYTFIGSYKASGVYNVRVLATDGYLVTQKEWRLIVKDVVDVEEICLGLCCGVKCSDSIVSCKDGYIASCSNTCDAITGKCSSCTPVCVDYSKTHYQLPGQEAIGVSKRTVPCVNITASEKKEITLEETNLPDALEIPKDYSIILTPFNLNCNKEAIDLTVSIPDDFTDVKALKCVNDKCYPSVIKTTTRLACGEKIINEIVREENYLKPEFFPIEIKEVKLNLTSFKDSIESGENKVRFYGLVFERLSVSLGMPNKVVQQPKNVNLKIVGTPLLLKLDRKDLSLNSTITMPLIPSSEFDKESYAIYIKDEEGWDYIGGNIDQKTETITANIINITKYLNEGNEIEIAVIGILCNYCTNTSLEKVYEPKSGSREAIVLVHGLASSPATYEEIINDIKLTNQPFQTWTFAYPSSRTIEENAREFANLLEINSNELDTLYIAAHSLGGLITQEALYYSYKENIKDPNRYTYLNKVRKVILVGVPNEGAVLVDAYEKLYRLLVNRAAKYYNLFNINSKIIDTLIKGSIIPRVPGIDYYVIAGTNPYELGKFSELKFINATHDGVVSVKSAQHIGDEYINDKCSNYWEVYVTHTQLIDDPTPRRLIEKIVAQEILKKTNEIALIGNNKYFNLKIEGCSSDDKYIIIGKKIKKEAVYDELGCACGNNICGEGENEINCPSDCADFFIKKSRFSFLVIALIVFITTILFTGIRLNEGYKLQNLEQEKLNMHIKDEFYIAAEDGYTKEQIKKILKRQGWHDKTIDKTLDKINKDFNRKYSALCGYAYNNAKKGIPKEKIMNRLVEAGWGKTIIEKAFQKSKVEPLLKKKEIKETRAEGKFIMISNHL